MITLYRSKNAKCTLFLLNEKSLKDFITISNKRFCDKDDHTIFFSRDFYNIDYICDLLQQNELDVAPYMLVGVSVLGCYATGQGFNPGLSQRGIHPSYHCLEDSQPDI